MSLFRILHDDTQGELSYLLADTASREAVLIDPHGRDFPVLTALLEDSGLRLRWVLRTHDHDGQQPGEFERLAGLGAPVVQGRPRDGANRPSMSQPLVFGGERLKVIDTPGHTAHCLSFMWRDRLFCGGLLAVQSCPHQAGPALPDRLWDSVNEQLFCLPDETLLFAGHARQSWVVSTVFEQRRWNPVFAGTSRDGFLARMADLSPAAPEHTSHRFPDRSESHRHAN